jgi:CRISPR/Cas system endoribonuclease Cas6 (RAMP superfamily)
MQTPDRRSAPDRADEIMPHLVRAGEFMHVGKGCVMGLGQYRSEVPA